MPMSSRAAWGLALGLLGIVALVTQSLAKQEAADRKAANAQAPAANPPSVARIGTINMTKVMKDYKKYKFIGEQIQKAALERQGDLSRIASQMKAIAKDAEGLDPNSNDFKAKESKLVELKAELEAKKEQAQAEFARREADALATIYKDVQEMTAAVAKYKGYNYIVRVNPEPFSAADPNVVLAAIERPVVFSDPASDITEMVLLNLNRNYDKATATPGAKPTSANTAPATSAAGNAASKKK
jgi:Skp family chaperone for outer membrane proteins